jgi:hypothetical protein
MQPRRALRNDAGRKAAGDRGHADATRAWTTFRAQAWRSPMKTFIVVLSLLALLAAASSIASLPDHRQAVRDGHGLVPGYAIDAWDQTVR